jgi:hypothetical protein
MKGHMELWDRHTGQQSQFKSKSQRTGQEAVGVEGPMVLAVQRQIWDFLPAWHLLTDICSGLLLISRHRSYLSLGCPTRGKVLGGSPRSL